MHFTVRLGKRNTSVRIRDDLLALWYVLCFPDEEITYSKVQNEVRRFLGKCLAKYRPASRVGNQGVTDYVNAYIVAEVLEAPERHKYKKALKMLKSTVFNESTVDLSEMYQEDSSAPLYLGIE